MGHNLIAKYKKFLQWVENHKLVLDTDGQAEASNKTLLTALRKRLHSAKGKWVEELPGVL